MEDKKPNAAAMRSPDLIPRRRGRVLLALARSCYKTYLRLNGWRPVLLPSPLKGGGMLTKWVKTIGPKKYQLPLEEALQSESNLHRARMMQLAAQQGRI